MNFLKHDQDRGKIASVFYQFFADPIKRLVDDEALADEIRGRQTKEIKVMTPLMLMVNLINVFITIFILYGEVNLYLLGSWAAFSLSVILAGMASVGFRFKIVTSAYPRKSTYKVVLNAVVLALMWCALPVLFFTSVGSTQQIFITCIVAGMMGGGTMALSLVPVAARAFCWMVGLGAMAVLVGSIERDLVAAAMLVITYAVVLSRAANQIGERFVERCLDERKMQEQQATIGMLLKDFEDSSSDWMWETDKDGIISNPSSRFCESLGRSSADISGAELAGFISLPQAKDSDDLSGIPLNSKLKIATPFRDHTVQVDTDLGPRWWSFTGKPLIDQAGNLTGFRGTASDVQEARLAQDKIHKMALYDPTTGLSNRNHFQDLLSEVCLDAVKHQIKFAVLYIDLDRFKAINDSLGHITGDALLRETANRLQGCLNLGDVAARFGGDEFAVILRSCSTRETAEAKASEIVEHLKRPFLIGGHTISSGASIGISEAEGVASSTEALMRNADLALYRAKAEGGSTYKFFKAGMDVALQERRELEVDMRDALRRKEFVLYYQPLASVSTNEVTTYEALIRWKHPTRGVLLPEDFIPLAEETGLINDIGDWVLEQACSDAMEWALPHRVAVNISARQVMSQRLLMYIMRTLEKTKLPAKRLELEVTESVLIENPERTRRLFTELRKLGVGISLDDFGTGYSSLSYLVRFPFDKVKIDKTFIQSAEQSEEDMSIIRSILGLAGNLGIRTTAEGIETAEQLKIAQEEGCDEMQGYLIQEPAPMEKIAELKLKSDGKQKAAA